MPKRRTFTAEFKSQLVLKVISGEQNAAELCRQHQIKPQLLSDWKATFLANAATVFQSDGWPLAGDRKSITRIKAFSTPPLPTLLSCKAQASAWPRSARPGRTATPNA